MAASGARDAAPPLAPAVAAYYARGGEARRLFAGHGRIELARTQELILRHLPHELEAEARDAGLAPLELVGVEGPGWLLADLAARWRDPAERARLLWAARAVEREPTLLGLSPHVMVVARKPAH